MAQTKQRGSAKEEGARECALAMGGRHSCCRDRRNNGIRHGAKGDHAAKGAVHIWQA